MNYLKQTALASPGSIGSKQLNSNQFHIISTNDKIQKAPHLISFLEINLFKKVQKSDSQMAPIVLKK